MNIVALVGNLATDVELRETPTGKKVGSFRLAVHRNAEETDFVGVTVWERQAELCAQHLTKGQRVAVDGRLRSHSWETAEGEKRSAVEVVANRVDFLQPRRAPEEVVPFDRPAIVS